MHYPHSHTHTHTHTHVPSHLLRRYQAGLRDYCMDLRLQMIERKFKFSDFDVDNNEVLSKTEFINALLSEKLGLAEHLRVGENGTAVSLC